MNYKNSLLGIVFVLLLVGCKKDWDDHYNTQPSTSNENVWDALQKEPNVSDFVAYLKEYQYDTLFLTNYTYTVFAPTNEAFSAFLQSDTVSKGLLAYHISSFFIQSGSINGTRKVQTFNEKYVLFSNTGGGLFMDEIPLAFESPLYKNGKYFILNQVALPKPNLYEFIALNNQVLKQYIDSEDSLVIDRELSKPIGFDDQGNIIYDTVADIINMFEIEYFPVSEEFRNKTATIVFPREENYNNALTEMAQEMSSTGYVDYRDIPIDWQNEVLVPYLLERGVFENMLEREEFLKKSIKDTVKLMNVLGDSVVIDYEPGEKFICSNGYAYDYFEFKVPDTLWAAPLRFEAERLTKRVGSSFAWLNGVKVLATIAYPPTDMFLTTASNDSLLWVNFDRGYTGQYSVEFNIDELFPRRFLAVFRIQLIKGGIFEIFVNDQLVRRFDYGTDISSSKIINSVIPGKRYLPQNNNLFNRFDCWVENLEEYGKAKIRIDYKGPSTITSHGIALDYIEFVPYD